MRDEAIRTVNQAKRKELLGSVETRSGSIEKIALTLAPVQRVSHKESKQRYRSENKVDEQSSSVLHTV